jgi:hypothetical protein
MVSRRVLDDFEWGHMAKWRAKLKAERVVIARTHYAGRDYVAIRSYFSNASGRWYPSKRGINLRADLFAPDAWRDLRNALMPPRRPGEPEMSQD